MNAFLSSLRKVTLRRWIERLALFGIIFGIFSICQPFTMFLYRHGFSILLYSTLTFIVVSHIKDKEMPERESQRGMG